MKKTKLVSVAFAATLCAASFQASSFFILPPLIGDYLKFAKAQLATLQKQTIFGYKIENIYEYMEQIQETTSAQIDQTNENYVARIATSGKKDMTIQNLEIASKSVPAFMPCSTVTNTILLKNAAVTSKEHNKQAQEFFKSIETVADKRDGMGPSYQDIMEDKLEETIAMNPDIFDTNSEPTVSAEEDSKRASMFNATLFMPTERGVSTLDEDQQKAMEGFVLLVAPPYQTSSYEVQSIKDNKEAQLSIISEKIKRNLTAQIFNRVLSKKIPTNGNLPSELGIQEQYVNDVFLNEKNSKATMAYKISTSDLANPATVQRNRAILQAYRINNAINEYKEMLATESVLAARLMEKLNK